MTKLEDPVLLQNTIVAEADDFFVCVSCTQFFQVFQALFETIWQSFI